MKNLLTKCDTQSHITPLFFDGRKTLQTFYGGIASIITSSFMLTICIVLSQDIYYHQKPSVVYSEENINTPEKIVFNSSDFIYIFALVNIVNYSPYIDETIYFPTFTQNIFVNGQLNSSNPLKLQRCSEIQMTDQTKLLTQGLPLDKYYCLVPNQTLILWQTVGQPNFSYFRINFFPCKNSSLSSNCKDAAFIKNYLKGGSMNQYILDYSFDPNNYTSPAQPYLNSLTSYFSSSYYKSKFFIFKEVIFNDDKGIFYQTEEIMKYHAIDQINVESDFREDQTGAFLICPNSIGKKVATYKRHYKKLQSVIAEAGGFLAIVKLCFVFLLEFRSKRDFQKYLLKDIILKKKRKSISETTSVNNPQNNIFVFNKISNLQERFDSRRLPQIPTLALNHKVVTLMEYFICMLDPKFLINLFLEVMLIKEILFNENEKMKIKDLLKDYDDLKYLANICIKKTKDEDVIEQPEDIFEFVKIKKTQMNLRS
jgi:hypothetical protein